MQSENISDAWTLVERMDGSPRVERSQGLVRDVKIVGFTSTNKRVYLREALSKAAPLYEQAKVFLNHVSPTSSVDERRYEEQIGRLSNVRLAADGLRGDLRVNPKHPLAEALFWDAEHAPAAVGLSHHAEGRGRQEGETFVVEEIVSVQSVDLVVRPAATRGLFESEGAAKAAVPFSEEAVSPTLEVWESRVRSLQEELDALRLRESQRLLEADLDAALAATDLPSAAATETFREILRAAPDATRRRSWIEDRAELCRRLAAGRVRPAPASEPPRNAAEFVARLRAD